MWYGIMVVIIMRYFSIIFLGRLVEDPIQGTIMLQIIKLELG